MGRWEQRVLARAFVAHQSRADECPAGRWELSVLIRALLARQCQAVAVQELTILIRVRVLEEARLGRVQQTHLESLRRETPAALCPHRSRRRLRRPEQEGNL